MTREEFLKRGEKKEDSYLFASIWDKKQECLKNMKICTTCFLDELQQKKIQKAIQGIQDISFMFWGGYEEAERKLLILYSKDFDEIKIKEWQNEQEEMLIIRILLPKHKKEIYEHRRYLGAIMKLGVEREMIGDILVDNTGADIIVKKEVANFLENHLAMLTRFQKAKITKEPITHLKKVENKIETFEIIVSSMRVDAIIAELIKTSRGKAVTIIEQERVFANGELVKKITKNLRIGDKITVRGKGRFYLIEEIRKSKSGKIVLSVGKNR